MDFEQLRRAGGGRVEHQGTIFVVTASTARREVIPGVVSSAAWEIRGEQDPERLVGYVDASGSGSGYAYDPMAWSDGVLGLEVHSIEEAVRKLLRD